MGRELEGNGERREERRRGEEEKEGERKGK